MARGLRAQGPLPEFLVLVQQLRDRQGDDDEALAHLVPVLWPRLLQYALPRLRWLADADDAAADVASEALERAVTRIATCRAQTEAEFLAWVLAIARRLILDLRRGPPPIGGAEPLLTWYATKAVPRQPQPQVARRARAARAARASLEPDLQALVLRRVLEAASWRELAAEFACSASAARRRFERARRLMRASLESEATRPGVSESPRQRRRRSSSGW